jgi:hypothetical protein
MTAAINSRIARLEFDKKFLGRLIWMLFQPFNFGIPVLGVVDDLFLLPLLLHGLAKIAFYATTLPSTPRPRDDRVVSVQ